MVEDGAGGQVLGVADDAGDVDLTTPARMDAFLAKDPVRDIPRQGGRPLVLHTRAPSVEAAKQLYAAWQERMATADLR